jgi:protein AATF/BFR2
MVPIPQTKDGWHEEQIDELFASLLGRGYETSHTTEKAAPPTHEPIVVDANLLNGLRVF